MFKLDLKNMMPPKPSMQNMPGTWKSKKVAMAAAACVLLAALAYVAWDNFADGPAIAPKPLPRAEKPATPDATKVNKAAETPPPMQLHSVANSQKLSELLAEKQLREAELAVRELDKKISGLKTEAQLPALIAPPGTATPEPPQLPRVRSVFGLDGKLKAVLVGGGAVRTVKAGDGFMRGKVESISLNGVQFKAPDGTVHTLSFED